jgi:hypothetical protein
MILKRNEREKKIPFIFIFSSIESLWAMESFDEE